MFFQAEPRQNTGRRFTGSAQPWPGGKTDQTEREGAGPYGATVDFKVSIGEGS